jgi:hypothetical protein
MVSDASGHPERAGNGAPDVAFDVQQLTRLTLVCFGPDVEAFIHIDQACRDANPVRRAAHGPYEYSRDTHAPAGDARVSLHLPGCERR